MSMLLLCYYLFILNNLFFLPNYNYAIPTIHIQIQPVDTVLKLKHFSVVDYKHLLKHCLIVF